MIHYDASLRSLPKNMFRMHGSVFPRCATLAFFNALLTIGMHYLYREGILHNCQEADISGSVSQGWNSLIFLIGFLIVFRTGQAYSRWWGGCESSFLMRAEWLDAVSSVMAFSKESKASESKTKRFKNMFIRLMSMLHGLALASIEVGPRTSDETIAERYNLLDPLEVDMNSLEALRECDFKVELLYTWIQQLLCQGMREEVLTIPAPIFSRSFAELANGMLHYNSAMQLAYVPFPFAYAQVCDALLALHWILSPLLNSQIVSCPSWAASFAFVQVFVLWAMNLIATEIEDPFGQDPNDVDGAFQQEEFNNWLAMMLTTSYIQTPAGGKCDRRQTTCIDRGRVTLRKFLSPSASTSNVNLAGESLELRSSLGTSGVDVDDNLSDQMQPMCSIRPGNPRMLTKGGGKATTETKSSVQGLNPQMQMRQSDAEIKLFGSIMKAGDHDHIQTTLSTLSVDDPEVDSFMIRSGRDEEVAIERQNHQNEPGRFCSFTEEQGPIHSNHQQRSGLCDM